MNIPEFDQAQFNEFVLGNGIIGFLEQPITLKSGRISNVYVNWRNIAEDVALIDQLSDSLISFTQNLGFIPDCFYGVPEGATKLGVITQYKWAKLHGDLTPGRYVLAMGRGKPKDHGAPKDKYFVGIPKGKTIIVEDTTTTGGSLITTVENLLESGVEVIAAIGLTDRNELRDDKRTVGQVLASKQVPYYAMSGLNALLPELYKRLKPSETVAASIEEYFKTYGSKPLTLR